MFGDVNRDEGRDNREESQSHSLSISFLPPIPNNALSTHTIPVPAVMHTYTHMHYRPAASLFWATWMLGNLYASFEE